MRLSLNWLNEYVDLRDLPVGKIAATLTDLGLEVEEVEELRPIPSGVVVGRVVQHAKHPNADTLSLCQVDVGKGEPLRIVCGAPNARAGLTVAVATIGTDFGGGFKIKATKIRGEASEGMLCSEKELGLSESHEGIVELDGKFPLGHSFGEVLGLNDTVITISLTPNRADCLGYIGVARELAARLERPLRLPDTKNVNKGSFSSKEKIKIQIENPADCARFSALYIKDVRPIPSPRWLQKRLEAAGMRPINLIVDVTNYVMLEYSHPIHAYDERDIRGGVIQVRRAKASETLTTLDGIKRPLLDSDLVICDAQGPIGLAGVMGGENSEVKEDTKNIILEVAHFNASLIRKTSKRLGLHTEASHRFERGVDVDDSLRVANRVADLLQKCATELKSLDPSLPIPTPASDTVDAYPVPAAPARIALRLERVRRLTGLVLISKNECVEALESIGIKLLDKMDERMLFEIPTWRVDIEREVDLIEEVARLHGYDKLPTTLPLMEIGSLPEDPFVDFVETGRRNMAVCGMTETMSFPFLADKDLAALNLPADHPMRNTIVLQNPLSEDMAILTPTLAINLLRAVVYNRSRGAKGARLFEMAKGFYNLKDQKISESYPFWRHLSRCGGHISSRAQADQRPCERWLAAGVYDQPLQSKGWHQQEVKASFFDAKALVVQWLSTFGVDDLEFTLVDEKQIPWVHPRRAAVVYSGKTQLGYIGEAHPKTCAALELDLDEAPILFELDLDHVFEAYRRPSKYDSNIQRFPPSLRDLALVLDKKVTHKDVLRAIQKFKGRKFLTECVLFDVYEGKNIPENKKSMAYSFSFQSPDKTLTDKEVDKEIDALLSWLKENLAAELR